MGTINSIGYIFVIVFLIAVVIALSAQFLIRIGLVSFQNRGSNLETWHRFSGWIALGGLSGVAIISTYQRNEIPILVDRIIFLHVPLLTICAAVKLRKGWVNQSKRWRSIGKSFAWWITNLIIGMSFCIVTGTMIIWQYFDYEILMISSIKALPYQSLILGHIGLAFVLIWLGRKALGRDQVLALNLRDTA